MFNGVHINPQNNADEETPSKGGASLYLNEMTQDVIEWDESNNMDLNQKYRSPQPSSSCSKSSQSMATRPTDSGTKSKSNTPLSTSTNNSSLFAGVKRQFDPRKSHTKAKKRHGTGIENTDHPGGNQTAPNDIDGVYSIVDNSVAKNELQERNCETNFNCSAASLAQRHRRRRFGYPQEHQNERNSKILSTSVTSVPATAGVVLYRKCPTTASNNSLIPSRERTIEQTEENSAATRHDDFAHLLEAITTPKSGQVPRVQLSPVNQNRSTILSTATESTTEWTGVDIIVGSSNYDAKKKREAPPSGTQTVPVTKELYSFPQPNFHEIPVDKAVKDGQTRQSNQCPSSENMKSDGDEFGEIEFSEDDLAKIDSLVQPVSSHQVNKQSECSIDEVKTDQENCIGSKVTISTKLVAPVTDGNDFDTKKSDETSQPACTEDAADEFGDFPLDIDFSQIDAMLSTQSSTVNEGHPIQRSKPTVQPQEAKYLEIHGSSVDASNTLCSDNRLKEQSVEREDEDEFGSFPNDVDFSCMDAVVSSQRCRSKSVDSKKIEEDDEFGDFPDDIDFNVLDQVVTEKIVAQPGVIINPSSDPVRNQRTIRYDCGETSFMNYSRYKVLSVDTDQRNNAKTLRVATWINSMADSDEMIKKILKDGKVKSSECHVHTEEHSCMFAHATKDVDYPEDGLLYLCGEWSFTPVEPGDVVHVCSLTGQYMTDATALPIVLHSYPPPGSDIDDLVLVLHPEMLMSPSIISETSSCNRRAALKSKMGSSGISFKSAFIGTMRHGLFEACMKTAEFDLLSAQRAIKEQIREKAEVLIGCNITEAEAEAEVLGALPMIQQFAKEYTTLRKDIMMLSSLGKPVGGVACHPDIRLLVRGVHAVEENIVSTPLGLKGSIDAVLETESTILGHKHGRPSVTSDLCNSSGYSPQQSLMCLELKTGHNQKVQNAHMAQLSLYTFMLQSRYGAHIESSGSVNTGSFPTKCANGRGGASGGILLYLNDKSQQICHVSPQMNEVKTLMSQRNVVASDSQHALRPRGISLCFEEGDRKDNENYLTAKLLPAPTANLPEVKSSSHSCERCFSKRECMLYAASDPTRNLGSHRDLISRFTGHLKEEDLKYFRKWDRLIDIEAESSNTRSSTPWLTNSRIREAELKESMSSMIFDSHTSCKVGTSNALVCFRRKPKTSFQSSFENLHIPSWSHVIVSTDGNPLDSFTRSFPAQKQPQNRMYVTKGSIDRIEKDAIFISTTFDEMNQIKLLNTRYEDHAQQTANGDCSSDSLLLFRLDKSTTSFGTGTLRWNLMNFLTSDYTRKSKEEISELDLIKQRRLTWLRDVVIRLKTPEFAEDPQSSLFHDRNLHIPGCNLQELSQEFHLLNDAQKMAVKKVMSGRDYTLIQGLPGTGKTSTLEFLTRLLVARGRRVLITAYTHSAVDNIMSKLMDKGMGSKSKSGMSALVRLRSRRPCRESLKPIIHSELALELDKTSNKKSTHGDASHPSAASLKDVIATSRVLGVSALSLPRSPLLQAEMFDVVIVDEAGQMNEPTAIGALAAADSFILVGDHKQLPPLVNSSIADRGGYGVSILKRLADQHPHAIAPLTFQYRMNEEICKISSESIYGGQLQCGNQRVKSQLLNLPGFPSSLPTPSNERSVAWLHSVVDPDRSVVFMDTDNIIEKGHISRPSTNNEEFTALEGKLGGSIVNKTEAKLVRHILEAMHLCGHDLSEIGVISPFRAQIKVIEDNTAVLPWQKKGLEMSTIDKYQGRDKSTIILSLVRSNKKGNAGRLLQDARRLNVAFTRAKCKLIVIGSYRTLSNGSAPLKPILSRMDMRKQRIKLPDNAVDCYNIE